MPRRRTPPRALVVCAVGAALLSSRPLDDDDPPAGWRPLDEEAARAAWDETLSRLKDVEARLPRLHGGHIYWARVEPGERRAVHLRRAAAVPGAPEEVVLDERALAAGHDSFVLGALEVSPDGRLLAYSYETGDERFRLYVKDLESGRILVDGIPDTDFSVAWDERGERLYYAVLDEMGRPAEVHAVLVDPPAAQPAEAAGAARRGPARPAREVVLRAGRGGTVAVGRVEREREVALFVEKPRSLLGYRLSPETGGDLSAGPAEALSRRYVPRLPPREPVAREGGAVVDAGAAPVASGDSPRPAPPAVR